jgi:hypothetical protein
MNPAMNLTQQFYNGALGKQNYHQGVEMQKHIYEEKPGKAYLKKNLNARTMRNTISDMKVAHTQQDISANRSGLNGSNIESEAQDFGLFTPNNISTMTPYGQDPYRESHNR